jgi:hypothetical protein
LFHYAINLQILTNDNFTIPPSPLRGASSLCTREPFYLCEVARHLPLLGLESV